MKKQILKLLNIINKNRNITLGLLTDKMWDIWTIETLMNTMISARRNNLIDASDCFNHQHIQYSITNKGKLYLKLLSNNKS